MIAGPNGSGKTTLTTRLIADGWLVDHHVINPDVIANREFGGWNNPDAVRLAANHAASLRRHYLTTRQNFAFETVFSTADKVSFLIEARDAGFKTHLVFVGTSDPQINVTRVAERVRGGGHLVPTEKIVARYLRSMANLSAALDSADRCDVFDNSVDFGEPVDCGGTLREAASGAVFYRQPPQSSRDRLPEWAKLALEPYSTPKRDE
jgi:predicted ABC-type ATPase